jgi:hypothetical protein
VERCFLPNIQIICFLHTYPESLPLARIEMERKAPNTN